jgi:hypothetical protein
MTNFDPGGILLLVTVIPAIVAGAVSIGVAHLTTQLGYGTYETNVVAILGVLIVGWVIASVLVTTSMLRILAVVLAMLGAFAVTRSITATSYGWVLGVVLLFVVFTALSVFGVYRGVDQTGRPQGPIAENLYVFYYGGLLVFGAVSGKAVQVMQRRWELSRA